MAELLPIQDRDAEAGIGGWINWSNATATRSTAQAHGGAASVLATPLAAGQAGITTYFNWSPTAGQTNLHFSGFARSNRALMLVTFYLRQWSTGYAALEDVTTQRSFPANVWEPFHASMPIRSDTITVYLYAIWTAQVGDLFYMDDMSVQANPDPARTPVWNGVAWVPRRLWVWKGSEWV